MEQEGLNVCKYFYVYRQIYRKGQNKRERFDINIYQIFDQKLKFKRNRNTRIFISVLLIILNEQIALQLQIRPLTVM